MIIPCFHLNGTTHCSSCLQLRNTYWAIHTFCEDNDIVIICDGNDWFARPDELSIIAQQYQSPDVWVTYSNFKQIGDTQEWHCRMPKEQRIKQKECFLATSLQ